MQRDYSGNMLAAVASDSVSISIDGTSAETAPASATLQLNQPVLSTSHQVAHHQLHTPNVKPEDSFHNVAAAKKSIGPMPTDLPPPPPPRAIDSQINTPSNVDLQSAIDSNSDDGSEEYVPFIEYW